MPNDFYDSIHAANEHLRDIQRSGKNVEFFQSLLPKLPDPNNANLFETKVLDPVRRNLCEQSDDGHYRYALVPIVAVGVAAKHATNRAEFDAIARLFEKSFRSHIHNDLFYWNHFNKNREGLKSFMLALRWAYHCLKPNGSPRKPLQSEAVRTDQTLAQNTVTHVHTYQGANEPS